MNPLGKGFISDKLPMTEDKGHIFVEYTYVVTVVYIILHICTYIYIHQNRISNVKTYV